METTNDEIIDAFGGTTKVAALCEISPPAVSQWRKKGIPKAWMKYFKRAKPSLFKKPKAEVEIPM